jgi:dTDP-4-amino-4,6-dideoxygalactose transaminase/GT2 family glycosyltransferase
VPLLSSTVVIATRDNPSLVVDSVRSVLAGAVRPDQLILVDQSELLDAGVAELAQDGVVEIIHSKTRGLCVAQNLAIGKAHGKAIVFTDDDVLVDAQWLEEMLLALERGGARAAVTGRVLSTGEEVPGGRAIALATDELPTIHRGEVGRDILSGNSMGFHRSTFDACGLFDERLGSGSRFSSAGDNDYCFRLLDAGYEIHYVPQAVVYHRARRTNPELGAAMRRMGRGQGAFLAKHALAGHSLMRRRLVSTCNWWLRRIATRPWRERSVRGHGDFRYVWAFVRGAAQWWLEERNPRLPSAPVPLQSPEGQQHVETISFVDLKRQYATIKDEVDRAVLAAIASTQYILGEEVTRFESEWAAECGVEHCVGVSSGTAGLALAYEVIGIRAGDEVIAPANTFIATVIPLVRLGAKVVLVDCDEYGQIDVTQARQAVSEKTRAIVGVDLFGHPSDADGIRAICDDHGLAFVEDAAQAHGATYRDRPCGSLGDIAAFSFYPGKNLGAYGDAGAITTNDEALAEKVRLLRDLGQRAKYEHIVIGGNERLDTIQAAVLRVKLRHLDAWTELRRAHAALYNELLDGSVVLPSVADWANPVWHLYVIRVENRDEVRESLAAQQVATGLHYPLPLHLQPALSGLGHSAGDFPVSEEWARTLLSLPMFPELQRDEIERVADCVRRVSVPANN